MRRYLKRKNQLPVTKDKATLPDAALLLAFLSGVGYLLTFSYEKGYKGYYKVNEIFMTDIGITEVLTSMIAFFSLLFVLFLAREIYTGLVPIENKNPVLVALKYRFVPTSFIFLLLMLIYPKEEYIILLILGAANIFVALWMFIIIPYLFVKDVRGYKNRMAVAYYHVIAESLWARMKRLYHENKPWFFTVLFLFCNSGAALASLYGNSQASREKEYYVVDYLEKTYVVLDKQGDNYLLGPVDINKGILNPEYIIVEGKSDFDDPLIFKFQRFENGLKVQELKNQ